MARVAFGGWFDVEKDCYARLQEKVTGLLEIHGWVAREARRVSQESVDKILLPSWSVVTKKMRQRGKKLLLPFLKVVNKITRCRFAK